MYEIELSFFMREYFSCYGKHLGCSQGIRIRTGHIEKKIKKAQFSREKVRKKI